MMHMVIYRSPDGQPVYHQTESLEEAARHLEQLRNGGQGADARIFAMQEIRVEVKTYYKVELPADVAPAAAAAPAPSTSAPAPPAPAPAPAAVAPQPVKGEPAVAAAAANGGRFGLFGKS